MRPVFSAAEFGMLDFAAPADGTDTKQPAQYREFLMQSLGNGVRVSVDGAVHFVCIDWRHISDLIEVGRTLYGAS